MKILILVIAVFLPTISEAQGCAVNFAPDTLKPSILESVKTVIASIKPQGQAVRLDKLNKVVSQLKAKENRAC